MEKQDPLGAQHLTLLIFVPNHHEYVYTHLLLCLFQKSLSKYTKFLVCIAVEQVRGRRDMLTIQRTLTEPGSWDLDQWCSIPQHAFHNLPSVEE
jgi:hypothetical protein